MEARGREWANWNNFKAVTVLSPTEAAKYLIKHPTAEIIPTRWVDTLKSQPWEPDRHKARLVVRGDLEAEGNARTDSPTCSQPMFSLVVSVSAAKRWPLRGGDITAAFLQGENITRTLVLSPPKDGIEGVEPGSLMIAHKPVYGTRDAPRGFWKKLHNTARNEGLSAVPHEEASYVLRSSSGGISGIMVAHVDDLLWCGDAEMERVMKNLQSKLRFGSLDDGNSFSWCGREIAQRDDGIAITCPNTAAKVRPIPLTMSRKKHREAPASDSEINQLRSILGSLNWVARVCRPDISYQLSALQTVQKKATVQDLVDCNALLRHVQETPDVGLFYKYEAFDFDKAIILSISDASHAANADVSKSGKTLGHRSQSGRLICLAGPDFIKNGSGVVHPIEYHSNVIRRVCRSTLQSETLSMVQCYEEAEHLRSVLHGLRHDHQGHEWKIPAMDSTHIYQLTDCRSLEAHLHQAGTGTTGDKRLAIDLSYMRQVLWRGCGEENGDPLYGDQVPKDATTHAVWVETKTMVADCLTKKMKCEQMEKMLRDGSLAVDMNKETSKKAMARNRSEMKAAPSMICKETMDVKSDGETCMYSIHPAQIRM